MKTEIVTGRTMMEDHINQLYDELESETFNRSPGPIGSVHRLIRTAKIMELTITQSLFEDVPAKKIMDALNEVLPLHNQMIHTDHKIK